MSDIHTDRIFIQRNQWHPKPERWSVIETRRGTPVELASYTSHADAIAHLQMVRDSLTKRIGKKEQDIRDMRERRALIDAALGKA